MKRMTAGDLQALELLMQTTPGFEHFDSGADGILPECRSCRFHRPHWKYQSSETRSNNNSYGLNYQKTGKELMSQDEIAVMDGAKCILQLRGVRPFLSNKYDITKHPKYRQLSDYDKRNAFDIEKYRQHKLVVKPDDTFDLYDMGEVEAD